MAEHTNEKDISNEISNINESSERESVEIADFIDQTLNSEFYLSQSENFRTMFEHFAPWKFYRFAGHPTRVYNINEVSNADKITKKEIIIRIFYINNGGVHQGVITPNNDALVTIDRWNNKDLDVIKKFIQPQIFINPLGYINLFELDD